MSATPTRKGPPPTDKEFHTSIKVISGVALVTCSGPLQQTAMTTCHSTLDTIVRLRLPQIVLDLSQVQLDPESITILMWMRRYVGRFGITLTLTGVSRTVRQILKDQPLDTAIPQRPADRTQRRAIARAERRDQWPVPHQPSALHQWQSTQDNHL